MKQEQVYIGGPMRGYACFNFGVFDSVAFWLRHNRPWQVHNPAEHDRETWPDIETWEGFADGDTDRCPKFDLSEALTWDLARVAESQHLVLLPGWEKSSGAGHERYVAELTGSSIWLAVPDGAGSWTLVLDIGREALKPLHHRDPEPVFAAMASSTQKMDDPYRQRIEGEDIERLERQSLPHLCVPSCGRKYMGVDLALHQSGLSDEEIEAKRYRPPEQPTVIGLVGYAQVGKDTLASILVQEHGFTRIAFADKLREFLYALNPIINAAYDGEQNRLQALVDRFGWDSVKVRHPEIRELLQRLGTEAGREILGPDIWVDAALRAVKPGNKYVITDVRFPNEFAAVERYGGTTVRIIRPDYGPVNNHWSETALDAYLTDVTVWNEGTVEELGAKAAVSLKLVKPVAS